MQIRTLSGEERLSLAYPLQLYAFDGGPATPQQVERMRGRLPYAAGHTTLVAMEDDGTPLAVATSIPMRQHVRGAVLPMAGIASVASHPLARRRGFVRALMHRLLDEVRETGHVVSALYPFRPSFYERFGYVGLPTDKRVTFAPADLHPLLRAEIAGEVTLRRIADGYEDYRRLTERVLGERHGYARFPDYRAAQLRDDNQHWVATASLGGEPVGVALYRIEEYAGDLVVDVFSYLDPIGRSLLLQFLARHVDQVTRIVATVDPAEAPELWLTDLGTGTESRAAYPDQPAPMARVLSVEGLSGLAVGAGRVRVRVVDDPFIAGEYLLDGDGGKLAAVRSDPGGRGGPVATLTSPGFAALVYGVLDPVEVVLRGMGTVPADAAVTLRSLFDRRMPFLSAHF